MEEQLCLGEKYKVSVSSLHEPYTHLTRTLHASLHKPYTHLTRATSGSLLTLLCLGAAQTDLTKTQGGISLM